MNIGKIVMGASRGLCFVMTAFLTVALINGFNSGIILFILLLGICTTAAVGWDDS